MSMDLYRKIMDDAASITEITEVCITGLSESLLDPHLVERVQYTRRVMPDSFINIYTNGTYLTQERYKRLQDAGLDMILVSLNAADAETRKRVMGLDDWETVIGNINAAIAAETTCKVHIRAVCNPDSFTPEASQVLYDLWGWREHGGRVQTVREGNWTGDNRTVRGFTPNECCDRAIGQIYITFEGKVTTCCQDPLGKMVFGDMNGQSLREVYNSEKYLQFREDHSADQADKWDICKGCGRI